MSKSRIGLKDTFEDIVVKMSDGNPGALNVMMMVLREGPVIDPESAFGGMGVIMSLDSHEIYGSRIWMLYKDVAKGNLTSMLAILRAIQLGLMHECALWPAMEGTVELPLNEIFEGVQQRLPRFGRNQD